jgi:hypothetical protein
MDVRVVDVSNHQGTVDWGQVLGSGRAGAICKATEGLTFVDGQFARNWAALAAAQIRGAYHFANPGGSSGAAQAQRFLSVVGPVKQSDLLVLDIEQGNGNLASWALDWLHAVQAATGVIPWVYSYASFLKVHLFDPALGRFPLWLAAYQTAPPPAPSPWTQWRLWQHTNTAVVLGISGNVDESVGVWPDPAPPAPPPPPQQEVSGVNVVASNIHAGNLDPNGHGWVSIPCPIARLLFLAARGSAPGRDQAYWPPISWDVNDSGAETIVTLYGQPNEDTYVYYSMLQE